MQIRKEAFSIKYYIADAFTDVPFAGNPAGVCVPGVPLSETVMQSIAAQNNLSETAFIVGGNGDYSIRWFTPVTEADLCGHATLASAFVVMNRLEPNAVKVVFSSASGPLTVCRHGSSYALDFPSRPPTPIETPPGIEEAVGARVLESHLSRDLVLLLESEDAVRSLAPDMARLESMTQYPGICVTAPGTRCDFVSRYFAPLEGIPEDPVTGSAHCTLAPFWARRLCKNDLAAKQLSQRSGDLRLRNAGGRVEIEGKARLYLEGEIFI